jgi:hypothetical protein
MEPETLLLRTIRTTMVTMLLYTPKLPIKMMVRVTTIARAPS